HELLAERFETVNAALADLEGDDLRDPEDEQARGHPPSRGKARVILAGAGRELVEDQLEALELVVALGPGTRTGRGQLDQVGAAELRPVLPEAQVGTHPPAERLPPIRLGPEGVELVQELRGQLVAEREE